MRHRLIALVIAFAVAAAPSLVGACEISCATTEAAGVMSPQHACHHQVAAPVNAPSLVSLHGCAHVDGLPVTAAEKVVSVATLPVNSVAASEIAVAIAPVVRAPWDAPPRPPDRSIRTTQLRI